MNIPFAISKGKYNLEFSICLKKRFPGLWFMYVTQINNYLPV